MTKHDWHVYTRDPLGNRVGEIDDYTDLDCTPVFNDVGSWQMTIGASSPQIDNLLQPRYGIELVRDGLTIMSGQATNFDWKVDESSNSVWVITGVDDNIRIKDRNAHPIPNDPAPPYSSVAQDTRTGIASTVIRSYVNANLGPGALSQRKMAGLTIDTDPFTGANVTGNARWDNLLTFLQTLAITGGVGFRIVSSASSGFLFQVYKPVDRSSSVKFSIGLGNLQAYEYTIIRPTGNYFFIGGDGDGTARAIQEQFDSSSISTWDRIEGDFVNSSGTAGSAQMTQDGNAALVDGAEQATLAVTLVDTDKCQFKVDYDLGDTVTIQLASPIRTPSGSVGQIIDTIQSVDIHIDSANGAVITPIIATAPKNMLMSMFKRFKLINKRLNKIEAV